MKEGVTMNLEQFVKALDRLLVKAANTTDGQTWQALTPIRTARDQVRRRVAQAARKVS